MKICVLRTAVFVYGLGVEILGIEPGMVLDKIMRMMFLFCSYISFGIKALVYQSEWLYYA